jgi:hypothetical protein
MGLHSSGQLPVQMRQIFFFVVPGGHGAQSQASRVRSLSVARCSKSGHLTNGLFGRRGQRGVFPATPAAPFPKMKIALPAIIFLPSNRLKI